MKRSRLHRAALVAAILSSLGALGCASVAQAAEERRTVGAFSRVEVGAGIEVKADVGPHAPLVVRADASVLPRLRTEVHDGTLHIGYHKGTSVRTSSAVTISLSAPRLDALGASGGAEIQSAVPSGERLEVSASGGAHVRVKVPVQPRKLDVSASGGGEVSLVEVRGAKIRINGSGGATVALSGHADEVALDFSGGCEVKAQGLSVARLDVSGSGGGEGAVSARVVAGELSGGTGLRVPRSASVRVSTSGGAEVHRTLP